jgi:hypothetical protein
MSTASALPHVSSLQAVPAKTVTTNAPQRNVAIGYLRAFITLLVLAHHAVLAYFTYAPRVPTSLTAQPRLWGAFPVIDSQRWSGFVLLVSFNDIFFMSLMFFLSGLFLWNSLKRKGSGAFLRDRAVRLGLPFLAAAAFIAPLAYYPAYLQTGGSGFAGFWKQWVSLGNWPAGPAWFVWVLLAFNCVAAVLIYFWPKWGESIGRLSANASCRPIALFGWVLLLTAAAYIPMELAFNSMRWSAFGPFTFQTSRLLHYFVYLGLGVGVGAYGLQRGLLATDGKLARRWWIWAISAMFAFGLDLVVAITTLVAHPTSRVWEVGADLTFVLSCAVSGFAFLALFVRFMEKRRKVWDSLSANAYGMYLIHYAFSSWLQYSLLKSALPAIAKGSLVFVGTVALSWSVTAMLRRIPAIGRVI